MSSDPPDSRLSVLCGNLISAIDRLVPNNTIQPSKHNHPWYSTTQRNLILERDKLYRRYRRTRQPYHLQLYCQARDHTNKTIESSILEYYYTRLSSIRDLQTLWKELRHKVLFLRKERVLMTLRSSSWMSSFARCLTIPWLHLSGTTWLNCSLKNTRNSFFFKK